MAQTVLSSDTTPWKALTEKLPGVLSVEFVTEGPVVREVHVLSDQSRSPKQIVRDIQSALLARFQLDLDHRIISVAQIPGLPTVVQRRLICDKLELSTGRSGYGLSLANDRVPLSRRLYSMNKAKLLVALTSLVSLVLAGGAFFTLR